MSIKIMSRVWEQSKQGGSQLLLLLAIADNANDAGFAWPGQKYLAQKIRMSERSIPRLAAKLKDAGELFVCSRGDTGQVTQYIVATSMSLENFKAALPHLKYNKAEIDKAIKWLADILENRGVTDCQGCQDVRGDTAMSGGVDIAVSGGVDIAVSGGVDIAVSTEPSLTINESSILQNSQNPKQPKRTQSETDALNTLTKIIASDPNSPAQTTDELRALTLIGYEIAQLTVTDILAIDTAELKGLAAKTIMLATKPDIDAKLKSFKKWWYNEYWLGKDKSQPPTVKQLGSTWGQFEAAKVSPAPNGSGPMLTEAEKARLAELIAGGGGD
jgi:hypothetical protein